MNKFSIDLNLNQNEVKIDKLYENATKKEAFTLSNYQNTLNNSSVQTTSAQSFNNSNSNVIETMDLSANVEGKNSDFNLYENNANLNTDLSNKYVSNSSNVNEHTNSMKNSTNSYVNTMSNTVDNIQSQNELNSNNINSSRNLDPTTKLNTTSTKMNLDDKEEKKQETEKNNIEISTNDKKETTTSRTSSGGFTNNQNNNNFQSNSVAFSLDIDNPSQTEENNKIDSETKKFVMTTYNQNGVLVEQKVEIEELVNTLKAFGINNNDINRIKNGEITIEELMLEIENDQNSTRRIDLMAASYLQSIGLEYTNMSEFDKAIKQKNKELETLIKEKDILYNKKLEANLTIIARLKSGEGLEDILRTEVVAWKYIDEKGNICYRYDSPLINGNPDMVQYEEVFYTDLYGDNEFLEEIKKYLVETTINPLFSKKYTVHKLGDNEEQNAYFAKLIEEFTVVLEKRNNNLEELENKITILEEEIAKDEYIYNYINRELEYYLKNIDKYTSKSNFEQNNDFNGAWYDSFTHIKEEKIYIDRMDGIVYTNVLVNSKSDIVNIIACTINKKGDIRESDSVIAGNELIKHYVEDWAPFITDTEIEVFNYIYNTEGTEAAYKYLEDISGELDNRWLANRTQVDQEYASEHPVLASISSVFITPLEGVNAVCYSLNSYITNEKIRRADVYSAGNVWRGQVSQDIARNYGEFWSFTYNTGMSMADTGVLIGVSALTGGTATPVLSATLMGSRSYVSTLNDALDRGLSDGTAITLAFSSAMVETLMESKSVGHLLDLESVLGKNTTKIVNKVADIIPNPKLANITAKSTYIVAGALSQGLCEGEEEFATEILNYYVDEHLAGDLSNHSLVIQDYINSGMTEEEARKQANKDFNNQLVQAFIGGFVSGMCFGGFSSTRTAHNVSKNISQKMIDNYNGNKAKAFASAVENIRVQQEKLEEYAREENKQKTTEKIENIKITVNNLKKNIDIKSLVNKSKKRLLKIDDVSRLDNDQIEMLFSKSEGLIILRDDFDFGIKDVNAVKKLIELYNFSQSDYKDISNFFTKAYISDFESLLISEDVKTLKKSVYLSYLRDFVSGRISSIQIDSFSDTFVKQNNEIFLTNILSDELRKKFYTSKITAQDVLNNLELFSTINLFTQYNIATFIDKNDYDFKNLISKIGLDTLKKVIADYSDKFYEFYNNSETRSTIIEKIPIESDNYYVDFINLIYNSNDFYEDIGFVETMYESFKNLDFYYQKTIDIIGKANLIHFFKTNFSEEMTSYQKKTILSALNYIISQYIKSEGYKALSDVKINEIFNNLSLEIIGMPYICDKKNFTTAFTEKYKQFFLPDDAPSVLKEQYYTKILTYEDIMNNLNYFVNTNISSGFLFGSQVLGGKFSNDVLLNLLKIFDGNTKIFGELYYFDTYLSRKKYDYIASYNELLTRLDTFYKTNYLSLKQLKLLKKIGVDLNYLTEIEENIKKSGILEENIRDTRLFQSNIIQKFGLDVVKSVGQFYHTNVPSLFVQYVNDKAVSDKMLDWFIYLNKNNLLTRKNLAYAILSFSESSQLIDDLISKNIQLNDKQRNILIEIMINNNKYKITNINEINDYINYKKNYLNNKFESNDFWDVKDAITETLFDLSYDFVSSMISAYNINNQRFYNKFINSSELMSYDVEAAIEILKEIYFASKSEDIYSFRKRFEDIIKLGSIGITKSELIGTIKNIYTQLWNQELLKAENIAGINTYLIDGVDSIECPTNVKGEKISSNNKINVFELDGQEFQLIVHIFAAGSSPDSEFTDVPSKLVADPSYWNEFEGATTISTSLISDKHIQMFIPQNSSFYDKAVVYGFNDLPFGVLRAVSPIDAGTEHGGGLLDSKTGASQLTPTNNLIFRTGVNSYNEVVLSRKTDDKSYNQGRFDGKLQPNCIICFDDKINDASKLAAQYFDVPIYIINKQKYEAINIGNKEKYESGQISSFENKDIEAILITHNIFKNMTEKQQQCIELCKKALYEGIITPQEYYERICYLKDFIEKTALDNYIEDELNSIINKEREGQ